MTDAENLARLTGITIEAAYERLIGSCTVEEIEQLVAEVEAAVGPKRVALARERARQNSNSLAPERKDD